MCAAAVWGLAVNERSRALLLELGVVQVLLQVAHHSLSLPCVAVPDHQEAYLAGGKISQAQRNQLQVCCRKYAHIILGLWHASSQACEPSRASS